MLPLSLGKSSFDEDSHILNEQERLSINRYILNKTKLSLAESAMFLIWDMQNGKCDFLRKSNQDYLRGE